MLFGEAPRCFIRSLRPDADHLCFPIVHLRWLGKRMSGQLTIMELSVMLTLGAIVSASMQLPDHDTLEGFLLLLCALGFQRGISYPGVRNSKTYDRSDVDRWLSEGLLQIINKKIDRVKLETIAASSNRHTYCLWQKGRIRQLIHALFDIRGQSIIRPKFWKFCEGEIK